MVVSRCLTRGQIWNAQLYSRSIYAILASRGRINVIGVPWPIAAIAMAYIAGQTVVSQGIFGEANMAKRDPTKLSQEGRIGDDDYARGCGKINQAEGAIKQAV